MPATTFEVVIEATDSKDTATSTVTLIITDENEPPVFHQAGYSVEAFEGNVRLNAIKSIHVVKAIHFVFETFVFKRVEIFVLEEKTRNDDEHGTKFKVYVTSMTFMTCYLLINCITDSSIKVYFFIYSKTTHSHQQIWS